MTTKASATTLLTSVGCVVLGAALNSYYRKSKSANNDGKVEVVLGAQWGDEGKGKLVDILSQKCNLVVRVAGGSNAGHTIEANGKKYKFHLIPSGILNEDAVCLIGNGVVVNLPSFLKEIESLKENNIPLVNADGSSRILLSDRAHLVFDFHMEVDGQNESKLEGNKIGTTKRGIGPAYASKISRNGVRLGDLMEFEYFEQRFKSLVSFTESQHGIKVDVEKELALYKTIADTIQPLVCDSVEYIHDAIAQQKKILVEGANAHMLDIDFGTYPYVTSSNPSVGSVFTGLGISPKYIGSVVGVVKAYCTRVGEGPFPTECDEGTPDFIHLSSVGREYGTTTGRPRRCGWLDIPQMVYACKVNGYTLLNLTKLDVLTGLKEIKLGVKYIDPASKEEILSMPASLTKFANLEIQYETFQGWEEDLSACRNFNELPESAQRYVKRVQELLGVNIQWIGVGAKRDDVIEM